jgi:hypothetical protein
VQVALIVVKNPAEFTRLAARQSQWDKLITMRYRWETIAFTGRSCLSVQDCDMNLLTATKQFNQRAAQGKWYHYCDPSLAFTDSYHAPLLNLWRLKSQQRAMPRRSDFSARDLKNVLRNIVIFERVSRDPSHYRWRLIGTNLTHMAGDNTGKMIEETLPSDQITRWVECFDLIVDGGQPLRFLGRVHLKGREYLDADNLFVPLANDIDEPTFAMGLCRYTPRNSNDDESWESQIASIPGALV